VVPEQQTPMTSVAKKTEGGLRVDADESHTVAYVMLCIAPSGTVPCQAKCRYTCTKSSTESSAGLAR
jgi:hypothetical protein